MSVSRLPSSSETVGVAEESESSCFLGYGGERKRRSESKRDGTRGVLRKGEMIKNSLLK